MNVVQIPKMIFSFHAGWDDILRFHPTIARLLLWLVLPLSLLPAAMIYYAGSSYGEAFIPGVTPQQWRSAAGIFLVAELLTVPVMAGLIYLVCKLNDVVCDHYACYVLASVAPVPLWLSALTLLVPDLGTAVVVGVLALACSVGLIYHGVYALFRMRDDLKALQMATVISGVGLLMWLLLLQIVLIHS